MKVKEAAQALGCSPAMIYKLLHNGQLGYVKVGARRLPLDRDVQNFLENNTFRESPKEKKAVMRCNGKFKFNF